MKPSLRLKDDIFNILKNDKTFQTAVISCSGDIEAETYNLAFCADFKDSIYKDQFTYSVLIQIYKTIFGYRKSEDNRIIRHYDKIVDINNDWLNNNKLWFRKSGPNNYETLYEYNSEYRDVFVLKSSTPLLTFSLNI